jgi:hypothetical protein
LLSIDSSIAKAPKVKKERDNFSSSGRVERKIKTKPTKKAIAVVSMVPPSFGDFTKGNGGPAP